MIPRDIAGLIAYLTATRQLFSQNSNLLTAWGPDSKPLLGAQFLPPRPVTLNENTLTDVRFRTVAAEDKTRYSPAPLVETGTLFASIHYRLGESGLAREIAGENFDAIVRYLNQAQPMVAAARLLAIAETFFDQALAEADELKIWDAIVYGVITRRGDNGYFEYLDAPNLANHRVVAAADWSDPTVNPWPTIFARAQVLIGLGYDPGGIRVVTTHQVLTILKMNPYSAILAGKGHLVTNASGQITTAPNNGIVSDADMNAIFSANSLQAPITYDRRIGTKTGQKRAYPEGNLTMIAATGRDEEVVYNQDDPTAVTPQTEIVPDVIGFNAIGIANGQDAPGRRTRLEDHSFQSNAHVWGEGWQATGPVVEEPTAITNVSGIQ